MRLKRKCCQYLDWFEDCSCSYLHIQISSTLGWALHGKVERTILCWRSKQYIQLILFLISLQNINDIHYSRLRSNVVLEILPGNTTIIQAFFSFEDNVQPSTQVMWSISHNLIQTIIIAYSPMMQLQTYNSEVTLHGNFIMHMQKQ